MWERKKEREEIFQRFFCPPLVKIIAFNWSKLILTQSIYFICHLFIFHFYFFIFIFILFVLFIFVALLAHCYSVERLLLVNTIGYGYQLPCCHTWTLGCFPEIFQVTGFSYGCTFSRLFFRGDGGGDLAHTLWFSCPGRCPSFPSIFPFCLEGGIFWFFLFFLALLVHCSSVERLLLVNIRDCQIKEQTKHKSDDNS